MAANRPYWQVMTISLTLLLTLVRCDASAVSPVRFGWVPTKPDSRSCSQVWENSRHRPIHTRRAAQKNSSLSEPVSATEGLLSVIDDLGFGVLLKPPTRVGSVGWDLSLPYLVYIILIISLTNPAVECMHVCECVHAGRGFPCPQLSRYV